MVRLLPCALAVALLGACSGDPSVRIVDGSPESGGGDETPEGGGIEIPDSVDETPDAVDPATDEPEFPDTPDVPDVEPLPAGARAGAYSGSLDDGSGVLVLDREERLIGFARRDDGSGVSWVTDFGDGGASGDVLRFEHAAPDAPASGADVTAAADLDASASSPLGVPSASAGDGPALELVGGERIRGTDVDLDAAGRAELAPVTRASITGTWQGEHVDCDSLGEHCSRMLVSIDIADNRLAGTSGVFTADDTDLFPVSMTGTLVPLGDFAEVVFEWNTYDYAGVVHFVPGESDTLVLIGYSDRELADYPVIATVLTRRSAS